MGHLTELAKRFSDFHNAGLTKSQQQMVADGLPPAAIIPEAQRAEARQHSMRRSVEMTAAQQETEAMKKVAAKKAVAKKTAKKVTVTKKGAAAQKKSQANARVAVGKVDVVQTIANMMAKDGGATMDAMVKETGIAAHPMRAKIKLVRDRLGYTTEYDAATKVYTAKPPKAAK